MNEEPTVVTQAKKLAENDSKVKELKNQLAIKEVEWKTFQSNSLKEIRQREEESLEIATKLGHIADRYAAAANTGLEFAYNDSNDKKFTVEAFGPIVKHFEESSLPMKNIRELEITWLRNNGSVSAAQITKFYTDKGFSEWSTEQHTRKIIKYMEVVEGRVFNPVTQTWNKSTSPQVTTP